MFLRVRNKTREKKMPVLTRRMVNNIHSQVSATMNDIISRVVNTRKVSFTTNVVSEIQEFEVESDSRMRRTPPTKAGFRKKVKSLRKKKSSSLNISPDMMREIQTPILCRTTPIPLSVVWKVAEKLRLEKNIDYQTWMKQSEVPHWKPEEFNEDIYP